MIIFEKRPCDEKLFNDDVILCDYEHYIINNYLNSCNYKGLQDYVEKKSAQKSPKDKKSYDISFHHYVCLTNVCCDPNVFLKYSHNAHYCDNSPCIDLLSYIIIYLHIKYGSLLGYNDTEMWCDYDGNYSHNDFTELILYISKNSNYLLTLHHPLLYLLNMDDIKSDIMNILQYTSDIYHDTYHSIFLTAAKREKSACYLEVINSMFFDFDSEEYCKKYIKTNKEPTNEKGETYGDILIRLMNNTYNPGNRIIFRRIHSNMYDTDDNVTSVIEKKNTNINNIDDQNKNVTNVNVINGKEDNNLKDNNVRVDIVTNVDTKDDTDIDELPVWNISLIYYIKMGDYNNVSKCIKHCKNIDWEDSHGKTALIYAIINKHHHIVRLLIESGADVNKYCPSTSVTDSDKPYPIFYSVFYDNTFISLKYLIDSKCNLNYKNVYGENIIMYMFSSGYYGIESINMFAGSDIDYTTIRDDGKNILMTALVGEQNYISEYSSNKELNNNMKTYIRERFTTLFNQCIKYVKATKKMTLSDFINHKDNLGNTVLIIAAKMFSKHPSAISKKIITLLMNNGADKSICNIYGHNAAHYDPDYKIKKIH